MTVTTTFTLFPTLDEFFGNTHIPGSQFGSTVVSNGSGGFLLSYGWSAGGGVGPLVDFYTNGTATPSSGFLIPYSVPSADVDMIGDPDMIRLTNGNYAVVWDSATQGSGNIRGAIFNAAGTIVAADFVVSQFSSDTDPQVTALTNGNWVAVMTTGNDIYTQLTSSAGTRIGGQLINDSGVSDLDPAIAALSDGGYAIAWTAENADGDNIWISIRNADGSVRVAPLNFTDTINSGHNTQAALATLQNGNIALVYKDSGWSGDGITLQIIDPATGANITPGTFIRVDTDEARIEQDPEVTVLSNGMIVVSWTHPFALGDNDIYGRIYTQSGAPVQVSGADTFIISGNGLNQTHSSLAALLEGRFVTSWTDSATEPGGAPTSIRVEVNQLTETLTSDGASDSMTGSALTSFMFGEAGNDTMLGGGGLDSLFGGAGDDTITSDGDGGRYDGGTGNDIMTSGDGAETMIGGDGRDVIDHSWYGDDYNFDMTTGLTNFGGESYTGFEVVRMGGGNDSVSGTVGGDTISGGAGNDTVSGFGGNDRLRGDAGNDTLFGGNGSDRLDGGAGDDRMEGGLGNDTYVVASVGDSVVNEIGFASGGGIDTVITSINFTAPTNVEIVRAATGAAPLILIGNDAPGTLVGNSGANRLEGRGGNDQINGNAGNDIILGGEGRDTLVGGAGEDDFVYLAVSNSQARLAARDVISGFTRGVGQKDQIDLSAIDANIGLAGAQDFTFIGTAAFTAAGQVRVLSLGGPNACIVEVNVNSALGADMQIFVSLTTFMTGSDFVL